MSGTAHLKYMLIGGAGIFGVLVLLGLDARSAVLLAIALACPLMMVLMMGGRQGMGHGSRARTDMGKHPHTDVPQRGSHPQR